MKGDCPHTRYYETMSRIYGMCAVMTRRINNGEITSTEYAEHAQKSADEMQAARQQLERAVT